MPSSKESMDIVGHCLAHQTAIGVTAKALDLIVLAVDEQSLIGIHPVSATAKADIVLLYQCFAAKNARAHGVAVRIVRGP